MVVFQIRTELVFYYFEEACLFAISKREQKENKFIFLCHLSIFLFVNRFFDDRLDNVERL